MMRQWATGILTALLILYPVLAYFLISTGGASAVGLVLVAVLSVRFYLVQQNIRVVRQFKALFPLTLAGIGLAAMMMVLDDAVYVKLYPVLVNVVLLCVFAYSLLRPPTIIESLARITHPDLPVKGVIYTRYVTWSWCGFFVVNGAVSLYTVLWADVEVWVLYNGVIAYVMMGALFVIEWFVRSKIMKGAQA